MAETMVPRPKVALVWRGDETERLAAAGAASRLKAVWAAIERRGMAPEVAVYDEAWTPCFRDQLLASDAVLVWVNPVAEGRRRTALDQVLREVAAAGVHVSAHPDVIDRMGVKSVLHRLRGMSWGTDTRFYGDLAELAAGLADTLAQGPRVLKPNRGNGGLGVRKVEALADGRVRVVEADGECRERILTRDALLDEWAEPLVTASGVVDQPFQVRLTEGMVRCYMSGARLAGFGHQLVRPLAPPGAESGPRTYTGPDDARFQHLRARMEAEWTPQMMRLLGIAETELPVIWDADLLLGQKDPAGADTYVLCEINVSSVFPIPDTAPDAIASLLASRLSVAPAAAPRGAT
jgi:hypothetical protein